MGTYTRTTRQWLDQRFATRTAEGHYFAHMPIYGLGHPSGEGNHVARLCRFLRILRALDGLQFDSMLDVGGAEGYLAHVVRTLFGSSTASTDLSHEASQRARELFALPSAAVDSARLPFADDEFDVVVCSEVLEHVESPVETMLELCRVARRAVVLTTEELRFDKQEIADYLFKRPGWPHMERNLFHPDDFTSCLRHATLSPQTDAPPPQEELDRTATVRWILEHTQEQSMRPGTMGVVATAPQESFASKPRDHTDEQLLERLLATTVSPGELAPAPSREMTQAWLARLRDPDTRQSLRVDEHSLHGSQSYPIRNDVPDMFVGAARPDREHLADRVAGLPADQAAACLSLRDRLFLPDRWEQRRFDLRDPEQRRGFWPNDQLVPRDGSGDGFRWRATGNDPWVVTPCLMRRITAIDIELRVHAPEHPVDALTGQVYWKGPDDESFSEQSSVKFAVRNDGDAHVVHVDLTQSSALPEEVQWLRLDLLDAPGDIDLLSITLADPA